MARGDPPSITRAATVGAQLGEAPLWLPERGVFLWLDLEGRRVHRYDPATGEDAVLLDGFSENLACLARWSPNSVLLVSAQGFHRLDPGTGAVEFVAPPLTPAEGSCFNDGKVDRYGALWIGASDLREEAPLGSLWRICGGVEEIDRGFVVSNGPAFAPDGSAAYFSDSAKGRILRFALDPQGRVMGKGVFATIPRASGLPDGMTVDERGELWVAHWDGARISRFAGNGRLVATIPAPARNVTSIAFGGPDMRCAIVTTAALTPDQGVEPSTFWNGDLLALHAPCRGVVEPALAPDWPS